MSPFARLGLSEDADEAQIKRAYARELKRTRPDEDPVGFQALNEAYRHCLSFAAFHRQQADQAQAEAEAEAEADAIGRTDALTPADADADSSNPAVDVANALPGPVEPSADHESAPPDCIRDESLQRQSDDAQAENAEQDVDDYSVRFDLRAFLDELAQRAENQPPAELGRWLRGLEPLYSLDLTQALRGPVAQMLNRIDPPLSPQALAVVLDVFSLDVVSPHDGWAQEHVHEAHVRAESARQFEQTVQVLQSPRTKPVDRMLLRELMEPLHVLRRCFIALTVLLPSRLISILDALERIDQRSAASRLDERAVAFWRDATSPRRLSLMRISIAATRTLLYYFLITGVLSALARETITEPLVNLATVFGLWLGWAAAQAGSLRWMPKLSPDTYRRVALGLIALVGIVWLAQTHPVWAGVAAFVIGMILTTQRDGRPEGAAQYCFLAGAPSLATLAYSWLGSWTQSASMAIVVIGLIFLHDLLYARIKGLSLAHARKRAGWLWYVTGALAAAGLYGLLRITE
ncbi:hypothetical protein [Lysobacter sp. CA199]|uniref:hypothetical protein n=1 Tax=Lysobacter sp. CA199 TaxID=3455608 RepID=UPI003F8D7147